MGRTLSQLGERRRNLSKLSRIATTTTLSVGQSVWSYWADQNFLKQLRPGTTSVFEVYVIATWASITTERITLIGNCVGLHVVSFV